MTHKLKKYCLTAIIYMCQPNGAIRSQGPIDGEEINFVRHHISMPLKFRSPMPFHPYPH